MLEKTEIIETEITATSPLDETEKPKKKKRFNKYTRDIIEKVRKGEVEGWCIDENGYINVSDLELRAKMAVISQEYQNRKNKKSIYDTAEYFNQEGLFKIKFISQKELKTKFGNVIVFNLVEDLKNPTTEIDKEKIWKSGVFESGVTSTYDDTLPDITFIIPLLQPGDECIIRLSKNYKGDKFYIRYMEARGHRVGLREED